MPMYAYLLMFVVHAFAVVPKYGYAFVHLTVHIHMHYRMMGNASTLFFLFNKCEKYNFYCTFIGESVSVYMFICFQTCLPRLDVPLQLLSREVKTHLQLQNA